MGGGGFAWPVGWGAGSWVDGSIGGVIFWSTWELDDLNLCLWAVLVNRCCSACVFVCLFCGDVCVYVCAARVFACLLYGDKSVWFWHLHCHVCQHFV